MTSVLFALANLCTGIIYFSPPRACMTTFAKLWSICNEYNQYLLPQLSSYRHFETVQFKDYVKTCSSVVLSDI